MNESAKPFDVESYPNYFLAVIGDEKFELRGYDATISDEDLERLECALADGVYGFNSRNYDEWMVKAYALGFKVSRLWDLTKDIIEEGRKYWEVGRDLGESCGPGQQVIIFDHFDLMEVAPGVLISLKKYGARLHMPTIQDLPYAPGTELSSAQMDEVLSYCDNDIELTRGLYNAIRDRIALRLTLEPEAKVDLRSKSDPQIAEAVIKNKLGGYQARKLSKKEREAYCDTGVTYEVPDWFRDNVNVRSNKSLNALIKFLDGRNFKVLSNGKVVLGEKDIEPIEIGGSFYTFGIGGLHSQEKSICWRSDDDFVLKDCDVTSYYPSIILNSEIHPRHIKQEEFTKVYREMVEKRVRAKENGDDVTASGLKIAINGTFGKLSSPYSFLYDPQEMLNVTLTGQLGLLYLIVMLELVDTKDGKISVVSANTDGVVAKVPRTPFARAYYEYMLRGWMETTRFNLEVSEYEALYSRDVNNYLAVKKVLPGEPKEIKGKGVFAPTGLQKDPAGEIIPKAVIAYLVDGTPLRETIWGCQEVEPFVHARNCTAGATWRGERLGKTVRWVWVADGDPILSTKMNKSGNYPKVATSDGALPVMKFPPSLPASLDRERYLDAAIKLLGDIGVEYNVPRSSVAA